MDIESDGPIPGKYSMTQIGAVVVDQEGRLDRTFFGKLQPISDTYLPEALQICSLTREETMTYDDPKQVMERFFDWIKSQQRDDKQVWFISDNNGFDFMFVAWYFHTFIGENPFGYWSHNLKSMYKGIVGDVYKDFRHLKKTKATHHPVDDAMGNAEVFYHMTTEMGMKTNLISYI